MLSIRLLGPVHVSDGDTVLPLPDRHDVVRLLAYLLLHRDRPLARKSVAFELWPDTPESGARQQLSRTLYRLQHEFLPPATHVPWVSTSISELRWHPEAECWLDVQHFDEVTARTTIGTPTDSPDRVSQGLESLRHVYRGDLLPDYADEWIVTWRQDIGRRFDAAMERLAQVHALGGCWEAAIGVGTAVLARDPLRETTHRTIMFAHLAAGDRGNALRHFARCVEQIDEQISSLPEPATAELARAIRAGEPPEAVADLVFDGRLMAWSAERADERPPGTVSSSRPIGAVRLPEAHDRFIGRHDACAGLCVLLATHRLVTLTGPGGCGKSRLAVEAARRCKGGFEAIHWVDLAHAAAPGSVAHTVAVAVGAEPSDDGDGALAAISARLAGGRRLLLLDNCEHVLGGCADVVADLIDRCPDLRILATSRERLNISAERVWPTTPLALPPRTRGEWLAPESAESVALFIERLKQREPERTLSTAEAQTAARICARLDGLPLAIELAAAQTAYLSLDEVDALLERDLDVLGGGARDMAARHATIGTTIDWSYQSLTAPGRTLFRQLAIFQGGATWQAIEAVCRVDANDGAEPGSLFDVLRMLVDKSLVHVNRVPGAPTRYQMLDLIRRFAVARVASSEQSHDVRRAHAIYYAGLAEALSGRLNGPDHGAVLATWDAEHPNCLAAMEMALKARDAMLALRIGVALWPYWGSRGFLLEGRRWIEDVLAIEGVEALPGLHSKALNGAASLAHMVGDYNAARRWYEQGLVVERPLGRPQSLAALLRNCSLALRQQSEFDTARALCEESLAIQRSVGDSAALAATLLSLGNVSYRQGRFADAARHFQESLLRYREIGGETDGLSEALHSVGLALAAQGRYADACHYLEQSICISRRLADDYGLAPSLNLIGMVLMDLGRHDEARASLDEGLKLSRALGYRSGMANALHYQARLALTIESSSEDAGSLAHQSLRLRAELGERHGVAQSLRLVAQIHQRDEEPERAAFMLGAEARLRSDIGAGLPASDRVDLRGCSGEVKRMLGPTRFDAFVSLGQGASTDIGTTWNLAMVERLLHMNPIQVLRRAMNSQPARKPERVLPELSALG